jgi:hypothetical protein
VSRTSAQRRTPRASDRQLDDPVRGRFHPSFPLVDAKLQRPTPGPGTVPRSRLIALLASEPRRSIVSIVAPAGFGKTLLLAEWAVAEQLDVAWLTLDDYDNEPGVFLTYVAAALDRVVPIDGAIASALAARRSRSSSMTSTDWWTGHAWTPWSRCSPTCPPASGSHSRRG